MTEGQTGTRRRRRLWSMEFAAVLSGRVVGDAGDKIAPLVLTFGILNTFHSSADLGLALSARAVPGVIFLISGGILADRYSPKPVMVICDCVRAVGQCCMAMLLSGRHHSLDAVLALQAIQGCADANFQPALVSLMPQIIPAAHVRVANAWLQGSRAISRCAGPAIAALAIAQVGTTPLFLADAGTYAVSVLTLLTIPASSLLAAGVPTRVKFRLGWRELWTRRWLVNCVATFCVWEGVILSAWVTIGPVSAVTFYKGSDTWGLVLACSGIGAVGGAVFMRARAFRRADLQCIFSTTADIPVFISLALVTPVVYVYLCALISGFGLVVREVTWTATLQRDIPNEVLGIVSGIEQLLATAWFPVGCLVSGVLVRGGGHTVCLVIGSAAAIMALTVLVTSLRAKQLAAPKALERSTK